MACVCLCVLGLFAKVGWGRGLGGIDRSFIFVSHVHTKIYKYRRWLTYGSIENIQPKKAYETQLQILVAIYN